MISFLTNYTDLILVESKMILLLGNPYEQLWKHYFWNYVLMFKRKRTSCELKLLLKSKQKIISKHSKKYFSKNIDRFLSTMKKASLKKLLQKSPKRCLNFIYFAYESSHSHTYTLLAHLNLYLLMLPPLLH